MTEGLRQLLKEGKCEMVKEDINKVICENEEIKMLNIRNRKKKAENKEKLKEGQVNAKGPELH